MQMLFGILLSIGFVYSVFSGGAVATLASTIIATYIVVLGCSALIGVSGQVSLGQGAFVGIGAYTTGILVAHAGVNVWITLPLAAIVGIIAGLVVGWPAARLTGVYLIVFTLMFGVMIPEVLVNLTGITGGNSGLLVVVPTFLESGNWDLAIAVLVAIICTIIYLIVIKSSLGRRWRANSDSEMGAAALGWSPTVNKITAFAFGSGMAAVGGSLIGILVGYVGPSGYTLFLSIYLLVAVVVGGPGTIIGALVGAAVIEGLPFYLSSSDKSELILGLVLVVIFLVFPGGLAAKYVGKKRSKETTHAADNYQSNHVMVTSQREDQLEVPDLDDDVDSRAVLSVDQLTIAYEGGVALSKMSLVVNSQEAVAIVGANGAGKSTLLRAISGWVVPASGGVFTTGIDITGMPAHSIARMGIAHVPEGRCIFPELSVVENLQLGYREVSGSTEPELIAEVLDLFPDLKSRLRQSAGSLSGGQQQMLAIGRGLMAQPMLLLLDEPCLGLAPVVIEKVFSALDRIRARGIPVVFVEQNVQVALEFADRAYVLSVGECVLSGSSSDLLSSDDLVRAYLV
jgi:ABC-type branched-subunit amino acid transport system ATPase component/ABC-type branched-subunit amino acid transport system permease subunit